MPPAPRASHDRRHSTLALDGTHAVASARVFRSVDESFEVHASREHRRMGHIYGERSRKRHGSVASYSWQYGNNTDTLIPACQLPISSTSTQPAEIHIRCSAFVLHCTLVPPRARHFWQAHQASPASRCPSPSSASVGDRISELGAAASRFAERGQNT
jgi:hypothetical protein